MEKVFFFFFYDWSGGRSSTLFYLLSSVFFSLLSLCFFSLSVTLFLYFLFSKKETKNMGGFYSVLLAFHNNRRKLRNKEIQVICSNGFDEELEVCVVAESLALSFWLTIKRINRLLFRKKRKFSEFSIGVHCFTIVHFFRFFRKRTKRKVIFSSFSKLIV